MKLNIKRTIFITLVLMILNIIATVVLGCGIYSFWCISREPETIGVVLDIIFGIICTLSSLIMFGTSGVATSIMLED